MAITTETAAFFWEMAGPLLDNPAVSQSTMMGFPCLRVDGDFFASVNPRTGDLVIKLPATRVQALIDASIGETFAPNGRRFREWVTIHGRNPEQWLAFMTEAHAFVANQRSQSASQ